MAVRWPMPLGSLELRLSQTSGSASDWDARYLAADSIWSLAPNLTLVQELESLDVAAVVDLAGGEGRNALWFASRGIRVENVEFSKVALAKFESRAKDQGVEQLVIANLGDARDAHFSLSPDLVISCYLQLPWSDLAKSLDNALAQLKSGEIFGIWHARRNLIDGYGGPQNPEVLPTPELLNDWLSSHGLVGSVWETERIVENELGKFTAIDVVMRARVGD